MRSQVLITFVNCFVEDVLPIVEFQTYIVLYQVSFFSRFARHQVEMSLHACSIYSEMCYVPRVNHAVIVEHVFFACLVAGSRPREGW